MPGILKETAMFQVTRLPQASPQAEGEQETAMASMAMVAAPGAPAAGSSMAVFHATPAVPVAAERVGMVPGFGIVIRPFPIILYPPVPRSNTNQPIGPSGALLPDSLYEDHADPNKRMALPIFKLAEQTVDGQTRLRVTLEKVQPIDPANQKWLLTVRFGTAQRLPDLQDLPYSATVLLRFTPPVAGAAPKEIPFTLEQEDAATWKATLLRIGLTERDEVVNAIKVPEYQAHFIVRCSFQAALPDSVNPQGEWLYREGSRTVDVPLDRDPFYIDPSQHPYIYGEVQDASSQVFGLKLCQVDFQGSFHHYYQDEASPYIFYYLPDCFKVTRHPDPPFVPQMLVKFRSDDGSLDKMRASLEYVAAPIVNNDRLQDARRSLQTHLPYSLLPGLSDVIFQPLVIDDVSQLTLSLALPRQNEGAPRQNRPGVVSKLSNPFQDELAGITLPDFQDLFDALFGKSAVVFMGDVQVAPSGNRPGETIPFVARLTDLSGRILEEFETPAGDGSVQVRLRNSIESPVTLRSIPVQVLAGTQSLPAHIGTLTKGGAATQFPVRLAPGEELNLAVVPDQPLPAGSVPGAMFGLDDIVVEPDSAAVWNAILDASVPAEYQRSISVMAFAEWFAPDTELLAIAVDFKNGDHAVLKRETLEAKANVRVPVSDLVLRNVQESSYAYTLLMVYKTKQVRIEKTDTLDILIPELPS